jgi:hypothetical protein
MSQSLSVSWLPAATTLAGNKVALEWRPAGLSRSGDSPEIHSFSAAVPTEAATGIRDFVELQHSRGLRFPDLVALTVCGTVRRLHAYRLGSSLVATADGLLEVTFRLDTDWFATIDEALLAVPQVMMGEVRDAGIPASGWRAAKKRARAIRARWQALGSGSVVVPAFDERLQVWDYYYRGPKVVQLPRCGCAPWRNHYLDSLGQEGASDQ